MAAGLAVGNLASSSLMAGTAVVGTCAGGGFPTIQAAVTASQPFSTIKICPGFYPEQVTISKPLTLIGITAGNAQNPVVQSPATGITENGVSLHYGSPVAAQILVKNAGPVNISNLAVDGSNNGLTSCGTDLAGIYYQNGSGTISNVAVRNQALSTSLNGCQIGEGIYIESGYGTGGVSNVAVNNSSVHGYQKNGITADGGATSVQVANNFIAGQGPTTGAAENGIQFSGGAGGSITGNTVLDNIYTGGGYGASGILIYSSQGVLISNNSIGSRQLPIVTASDSSNPTPLNPKGTADHTTISNNQVTNTNFGDGIDACSNFNNITGNTVVNTLTSGIHLDSTCGGTGKNNIVTLNTINESCAGVLEGASPNVVTLNTTYNVQSTVLSGDSCPSAPATPSNVLTTAKVAVPQLVKLLPSPR
jgi:hypothetical protein